jgi:hypothetical protein
LSLKSNPWTDDRETETTLWLTQMNKGYQLLTHNSLWKNKLSQPQTLFQYMVQQVPQIYFRFSWSPNGK